MLALPTAMPALVGPEAAVNAMYFNQIADLPASERAAFIKEKRGDYAQNINVYSAAADSFAAEAVVHPNALRDELIRRFELYSLKKASAIERRNAVHPV
jgi:acetyl-CoA carboxylase carboxyltransferase component